MPMQTEDSLLTAEVTNDLRALCGRFDFKAFAFVAITDDDATVTMAATKPSQGAGGDALIESTAALTARLREHGGDLPIRIVDGYLIEPDFESVLSRAQMSVLFQAGFVLVGMAVHETWSNGNGVKIVFRKPYGSEKPYSKAVARRYTSLPETLFDERERLSDWVPMDRFDLFSLESDKDGGIVEVWQPPTPAPASTPPMPAWDGPRETTLEVEIVPGAYHARTRAILIDGEEYYVDLSLLDGIALACTEVRPSVFAFVDANGNHIEVSL